MHYTQKNSYKILICLENLLNYKTRQLDCNTVPDIKANLCIFMCKKYALLYHNCLCNETGIVIKLHFMPSPRFLKGKPYKFGSLGEKFTSRRKKCRI